MRTTIGLPVRAKPSNLPCWTPYQRRRARSPRSIVLASWVRAQMKEPRRATLPALPRELRRPTRYPLLRVADEGEGGPPPRKGLRRDLRGAETARVRAAPRCG